MTIVTPFNKKAVSEETAYMDRIVSPSAGIIQFRFSGSVTPQSPSQPDSFQLPATDRFNLDCSIGQPPKEVNPRRRPLYSLEFIGKQCHNFWRDFSKGKNIKTDCVLPVKILTAVFAALISFLQVLDSSWAESHSSRFPSECGEIICRSNENGQGQIYVIAISHRDTLTRLNGSKTSKVQAEIYQIGDWLIHQQGVELLLPEGFFENKTSKGKGLKIKADSIESKCTGMPEMSRIEERLACDKTYVNAEMLLKENHSLRLRQVEDEEFYFAAKEGILKLVKTDKSSSNYPDLKSELDYLQERRTAAMLQRIPEIVDNEFQQGTIRTRKAVFTIGLSHLRKMIQYIYEHKIRIYSPLLSLSNTEHYISDLNLQKKDFAISIIIPRTLADDKEVLTMHGLSTTASQSQKKLSLIHH